MQADIATGRFFDCEMKRATTILGVRSSLWSTKEEI